MFETVDVGVGAAVGVARFLATALESMESAKIGIHTRAPIGATAGEIKGVNGVNGDLLEARRCNAIRVVVASDAHIPKLSVAVGCTPRHG